MKSKFTLVLLLGLASVFVYSQRSEAVFKKASLAPVVGGGIDEVWSEANSYNIDLVYEDKVPSIGAPGESYWKALWDYQGIYLLIVVADDVYFPGEPAYMYEQLWAFFDVNSDNLNDGLGSGDQQGHYQVDVEFTDENMDGNPRQYMFRPGLTYAFTLEDPAYHAEYFIPFSILLDKDGKAFDRSKPFGFDVTVVDRDDESSYPVQVSWANDGTGGLSWFNMDQCGLAELEGFTTPVLVESISIADAEITVDNGTLQLVPEILPANASTLNLRWSLEYGTGNGTVDQNGLVTAKANGSVRITGEAIDGSNIKGSAEVIISNQFTTKEELNVIRNGYFDRVDTNLEPAEFNFFSADPADPPRVESGHVSLNSINQGVPESCTFYQAGLRAVPDEEYEFSFVAWAEAERPFSVGFIDIPGNTNVWYGSSDDSRAINGQSRWAFEIGTDPTRYTFDVTFDHILPSTNQKVQFLLGNSTVISYLDSILLFSKSDYQKLHDFVPVESILLSSASGSDSVEHGKSLQLMVDVQPEMASLREVEWTVESLSGQASIDQEGIVTGDVPGKVKVIAMAKDGSAVAGQLEITITYPVGLATSSNSRSLQVYPVPARNEIILEQATEKSLLGLYNSTGVLIEEIWIQGTEHRIDISSYPPGIYFLRLRDQAVKFLKAE